MALKHIPKGFKIDSEDEVRFAVANYFKELGFEPDEFSFEDTYIIQLGRTTYRTDNPYRKKEKSPDSVWGRSDLLLIRDEQPVAIVEVKSPSHTLNDDDAWQAISYARLLRRRVAPFAIVTNGTETRVYDPLADSDNLVRIDMPTDSTWHQRSQSVTSIGEDLRDIAAKKLIGINTQTLQDFCQKQIEAGLEDLRGTISESMIYVPSVYLPRQSITVEFNNWLTTDSPCFAVIGDSGVGKTNFMCATAESVIQTDFALFYSAQNLVNGLGPSSKQVPQINFA